MYRAIIHGFTASAVILTALLCLPGTDLSAQLRQSSAAVRGEVRDQAGAPLPETTIVAKSLPTGQGRTVHSDSQGQFEILELTPGTYEFRAAREGYVSQAREGFELQAAQTGTLDFVLARATAPSGQNGQGTDGEAAKTPVAPAVNRISESQLVGLPLNGRSYSQLATLQAGISDPSAATGSRGIGGGGLTVAGGRSTSNNILLDGTNILDYDNRVPRSAAGVQLGSDAVLQVQVLSSNYGAEYGRNSGGVLNSITRSGTPEWHGTLFEFFRNSKLDAKNYFDLPEEPIPAFKRNQFGFTLTGPVVKERTFVMGSFEGLRDRLTETDVSYFPDELARRGFPDQNGNPTVLLEPKVIPYLELIPLPNMPPIGRKGIGERRSPQFLPTNESFFTMRLDHQLSERDSFFTRYTFDDATSSSSQDTFLFASLAHSRQQYLTLVASHIFSTRVLNAFRLGFTRQAVERDSTSTLEIPRRLFFVPDAPHMGQILIPGMSVFGPTTSEPMGTFMSTFQFADDLIVQRGAHALKMGFDMHRYRWNGYSYWTMAGTWSFNSLESFLRGGPEGTSLNAVLPGWDNVTSRRQTLAGFYLQDTVRATSRLQLNLGLRYEFASRLLDRRGQNMAFLPDPVRDSTLQGGTFMKNNPSLLAFAPRFGFTWSAGSARTTVLTGGFGVYYDQVLGYAVSARRVIPPSYNLVLRTNFDASPATGRNRLGEPAGFPDAVASSAGEPVRARILDYHNTVTPTVLRYTFSLQQALPGGWRFQASYVGARGNHLFRGYEANLAPVPETRADGSLFFPDDCNDPQNRNPSASCRPGAGPVNPAFGGINIVSSDAQSFYNSLQVSANRTFSRGVSVQASYTYSKSVDDASSGFGGNNEVDSSAQYGLLRTLDRGLSDFDIRHRLSVNYFLALPFGGGQRWWQSGPLSRLFGGWRLGGIVQFRNGVPFTPEVRLRTRGYLFSPARPSLLPGRSNNPAQGVTAGCEGVEGGRTLGDPNLYFDPCAFSAPPPGILGNLGRNTVLSPSVFNVDVSLQREFVLDGKRRLQFRAESFNLPNHPSFQGSSGGPNTIFSGSGSAPSRNPTAGRLNRTATTARQIQFALRFSF